MYSTVSSSFGSVEVHRMQFISAIKENIIPAIKYYPEKIKELKNSLEGLEDCASENKKKQNAISTAKQNNDSNKVNTMVVIIYILMSERLN